MLGSENTDFDHSLDFAIPGKPKSFDLNESTLVESKLFPGATISPCLKSTERGFRAHAKYIKGSKQSLLYRTCDVEMICLSGSLLLSFKNGSKTLKPGTYTQIPANTPYSLTALETCHLFLIGAKGNLGLEKVDLDVENE